MSELRYVGRTCTTDPSFTHHIARALGFAQLEPRPGESDREWLIRRLDQFKWVNRYWSNCRLELLSDETLEIAAMQICHTAGDYCQDRNAERSVKEGTFYAPKDRSA